MPIINTNTFWNYIINESEAVIDRAKEILTREDKDFQTGEVNKSVYYQIVNELDIDFEKWTTLRFPAGLTRYLSSNLMISVEDKPRAFDPYTKDDIYKKANKIKEINPKYEVRDYQIDAVYSSLYRFGSLIHSTTGSGKGQPVSLEIPTPSGFKKMGELKIGDKVFGRNGKPTTVTGIFPQGKQKIYEVEFTSGQKTICDENHLWTLKKRNTADKSAKTYSVKQLLNMDLSKKTKIGSTENIYCNLSYEPLEYEEKTFEIDPYILGVLIGDGSCNKSVIDIVNPENDIIEKIRQRLPKEYYINSTHYTTCPHHKIQMREKRNGSSFLKKIKKLGLNKLSYEKFIPKEYLEGSIKQRIDLLHGLMDTDGCCMKRSKHSSVTFSTTSLQLIKDIRQLVFSLGGVCRLQKPDERYKTQLQHKHSCYQVSIQTDFCPFSCKSKSDKWVPFKNNNYLKSITYVGEEETICIKVDAPDELYITSDYVLTHNTSIMCLLIELLKDKKVLITNGNNFILQQIYDRLVSFGETDISWNKTEDPDYTKRIIIINTSSSDVRLNEQNQEYINFLKTVQLWCIDESSHFQSITNFEPIFYMDQDALEHVVGYTATPFRNYKSPYSDPSDFTLIALLGEPAFKYEMANTIADKNIAQPYSYFIRYKNTPTRLPPNLADNYFMQYRSNIIYNKNRNAAGFAMIKFLNEYNIKTLVSLNNIKPGQKLLKKLAENGIKALFICGNETIYEYKPNKRGTIKLEERKGNVEDVKIALSKEYNIILATQVFDEGVDIEIFQAAILFSAGKSPIKILQVSGRASRKKAVNNVSFIIDFKDVGANRVFENQYKQRKELLEDSGVKNIEDVHKFMDMIKEIGYKS